MNHDALITKLTPSDLRAEAEKLIRTGKMPSLADVVEAIRTVKQNPDHVVPVVRDALVRTEPKRNN
jgi:hypothetical protein